MNRFAATGRQVTALIRDLGGAVSPSLPLPEAVDVGALLWVIAEEADSHLQTIKDRLRQEARSKGIGTHLFSGSEASRCQVVVPPPTNSVSDIRALQETLDPEAFNALFETVVTYKPREEFAQRLLSLPEGKQRAILQKIRMQDPTPRVSFKIREVGPGPRP